MNDSAKKSWSSELAYQLKKKKNKYKRRSREEKTVKKSLSERGKHKLIMYMFICIHECALQWKNLPFLRRKSDRIWRKENFTCHKKQQNSFSIFETTRLKQNYGFCVLNFFSVFRRFTQLLPVKLFLARFLFRFNWIFYSCSVKSARRKQKKIVREMVFATYVIQ